jgi:hypothetical protein
MSGEIVTDKIILTQYPEPPSQKFDFAFAKNCKNIEIETDRTPQISSLPGLWMIVLKPEFQRSQGHPRPHNICKSCFFKRDLWRGGALTLASGISGCRFSNHFVKAAFSGWTVSKDIRSENWRGKTERISECRYANHLQKIHSQDGRFQS